MKVKIIEHPLIQHKLTNLRKKSTFKKEFKETLDEISRLMAFEVYKDIKLKEIKIKTPFEETTGYEIAEKVNLFPILRAGLGMLDGFEKIIPNSRVGHIGLYRDKESLKPVKYLFKHPIDKKDSYNIVIDPIIATGGSAVEALNILKKHKIKNIRFVGLIASKEGIRLINKNHPDVKIFIISIERELNKQGYVLPGLGDAGDRVFGTK